MARLKPSVDTIRALSALLLLRILRPILIMTAIVFIACYVLVVLLALSFSTWWLLTLFVLVPLTLVVSGIGYVLWQLLHRLLPRKLASHERTMLHDYTEKLFNVAERTKTPYPVIIFLVGKDVLRKRESSFVRGMIGDSRDLMKDFNEIQKLFRDDSL